MALKIAIGESRVLSWMSSIAESVDVLARLRFRARKQNSFCIHLCNDKACWTYKDSQGTNRRQSCLRVILSVRSGTGESLIGAKEKAWRCLFDEVDLV